MKNKLLGLLAVILLFCCACEEQTPINAKYNTDELLKSDQLETQTSYALYSSIPAGPSDLLEDSKYVVLATAVENNSFITETNSMQTRTEFNIDKVIYGNIAQQTIMIYEDGGVLPYEEYYKAFHRPGAELDKSKMGTVVKYTADNASLIKPNKQYILFLAEYHDAYTTVGNFMGRYILDANHEYSREEPSPGFFGSTDDKAKANALITGASTYSNELEHDPAFTLEEIEALCTKNNT